MRGWGLLLAAVLLAADSGWAGALAAGSGNPMNDRLLALPPVRQAQVLASSVRHGCVGVSAFPMGVTRTGRARGAAYWSVRCKSGKSYAVQIAPDKKGTEIVVDCLALQGTGRECFKKF